MPGLKQNPAAFIVRAVPLSGTAVQECRGCGREFPYDPDADFCPECAAENRGDG